MNRSAPTKEFTCLTWDMIDRYPYHKIHSKKGFVLIFIKKDSIEDGIEYRSQTGGGEFECIH